MGYVKDNLHKSFLIFRECFIGKLTLISSPFHKICTFEVVLTFPEYFQDDDDMSDSMYVCNYVCKYITLKQSLDNILGKSFVNITSSILNNRFLHFKSKNLHRMPFKISKSNQTIKSYNFINIKNAIFSIK